MVVALCYRLRGKLGRQGQKDKNSYILVTSYKVTVKTSNIRYGGTDANIYIKLHGTRGLESNDLPLSNQKKDVFEQNQINVFLFENIPSVGDLKRVAVWHDNKGNSLLLS